MERALPADRIVAVGLLTRKDVKLLGPTFDRLWPVEDAGCFEDLLEAIDKAEQQRRDPEAAARQP